MKKEKINFNILEPIIVFLYSIPVQDFLYGISGLYKMFLLNNDYRNIIILFVPITIGLILSIFISKWKDFKQLYILIPALLILTMFFGDVSNMQSRGTMMGGLLSGIIFSFNGAMLISSCFVYCILQFRACSMP